MPLFLGKCLGATLISGFKNKNSFSYFIAQSPSSQSLREIALDLFEGLLVSQG